MAHRRNVGRQAESVEAILLDRETTELGYKEAERRYIYRSKGKGLDDLPHV
jgi:hypothetical protein